MYTHTQTHTLIVEDPEGVWAQPPEPLGLCCVLGAWGCRRCLSLRPWPVGSECSPHHVYRELLYIESFRHVRCSSLAWLLSVLAVTVCAVCSSCLWPFDL